MRFLVNERQEAGSFTATWDGTDAQGQRVASGIYLYRIQQVAAYGEFNGLLLGHDRLRDPGALPFT